ncbi:MULTISPECIES: acetyl-CoA C-acyltransferase [unclassified Microbacterium]|uniref:acetyl-CoA C-acyltransferase n=1 Tax=unclassified Microbacterium TaxID=2609290 RepID=UPI000EA95254|nr:MULTISPECIES: acetyl-CoA C-acyltransferase [unclassified Microbacterium]MBT2486528.1 acetyl-CoA C-acyltransferase [Microbacterium sp. ISL-108]RKN69221.1 acetyl-CoA C-acyltransferase [Microbacterium sp. CGR2]
MTAHLEPRDAVIVAYRRTPFGRARKGSLAGERPEDLALAAIRGALSGVPEVDPRTFDDFYLGTAMPEGAQGDNVARRIAVYAGWDTLPGATVNRFCASSVQALAGAARAIRAGDADSILVGGMESTSRTPPVSVDLYPGSENQAARADALVASPDLWTDPRERGSRPDVYISMGKTAEFVAALTGTTRRDQDEWAQRSQTRAIDAADAGWFDGEIVPYTRVDGTVVSADDGPRRGSSLGALAALPPAFTGHGTVTAGNASPLNDGASAAVVMSAARARELGLTPLARVLGAGASALSPEIMGLGPIGATRTLLGRLGLTMNDIDLVELNEAFAAQVVPTVRELEMDPDRVNVHGGAIAIGHPFGATGVRLTGTLIRGLQERDGTLGLVTLCVGGGQGMALVVERLS